jgi:hypothetical protein
MADSKITALTALTAADPANDMIPIVDVSDTPPASGNTKRISINNLLACSPSATLASATITGDLTVDTSTLKVDSANNRVGIGTASPAAGYALDVRGILAAGNSAGTIIGGISFSSRPEIGAISNHNLGLIANNTTMHLITPAGVFDWYDGAGGTRMTLNSTGLGVGVTPTNKLTIGTGSFNSNTASGSASLYATVSQGLVALADGFVFGTRAGVKRLDVDTSGNIISNLTSTAPTLSDNGFMVFNLTSNTNLMISVRGTDGFTRTANLTLA